MKLSARTLAGAIRCSTTLLFSSLLFPVLALPVSAQSGSDSTSATASAVAARLNTDVTALTRFPSRVPGTVGYEGAAAYVEKRMKEIGLQNVKVENYGVTTPVTQGGRASLNISGRDLAVYPVYPNGVAPSTLPANGLSAPVVYAGQGRPQDFNGLKVEGAIVALDLNSGMNWITAADLGARAIVFLQPTQAAGAATGANALSSRGEGERKFAAVSVEMPRFYAPRPAADAILASTRAQSGTPAVLKSRVAWKRVTGHNILGRIEGTDPELKQQTIVINSYYDSMSFAPDLAPGAEAAGNLAAFLEVARYFKAKPTKYSLLFVANGAHHLALAGTRNFIAQHFVDISGKGDETLKKEIDSYRAFIGLDLTSRTDTVGLFAKGLFYNQMVGSAGNQESILLNQFTRFAKAIYEKYAEPEAKRRGVSVEEFYVDGIRGLNGRSWRSFLPSPVALDSEVAIRSGKQSISFATANDVRNLQDTPFDLPGAVNLTNLARQIGTVQLMLDKTLNSGETAKQNDYQVLATNATKLSALFGPGVSRAIYRNLRGSKSFLPDSPVPNAVGYILDRTKDLKSYSGVRGAFVETAEYSTGKPKVAQLVFLAPRVGDPNGGGTPDVAVEAYGVDDNGKINFAPDMGAEMAQFSPKFNKVNAAFTFRNEATKEYNPDSNVLCFPARGVALYDTLDQRYFSVLTQMTVLDGQTDAAPVQFGYVSPQAPVGDPLIEPIGIVYGRPGEKGRAGEKDRPGDTLKIIMAQGLLGKRLVLLNTEPSFGTVSGKLYTNGVGIPIPDENDINSAVVPLLSYKVARDLWILNQQRISLLTSFGISNKRVDDLHGAVGCSTDKKGEFGCPTSGEARPNGGAILAAENAYKNARYDEFYVNARRAFGLESRAYPDVEATAQDVLKGILFYLALLLPFSFFLERLLFGFPDIRKQIFGTSVAFLIVFFGISRVHPAFELAMTPFIILLAFIILALTIVVTSFLSSKFESEIKRMKQGVHFADVGRISAISAALGLGIANMRRRPTRTALTCVTLILLTFTVLSFTSVTAGISNFARLYSDQPSSYQGMMVRQPDWSPMQEAAVNSMRNEFAQRFGPVALRSWQLARDTSEQLNMRISSADNPNRFFYAPALMGVTPEEKTIGSPIVNTVIKGRWIQDGDRDVCIVPASMLSDTNEGIGLNQNDALGKTLLVAGQPMTVIGIFDDSKWSGPNALRDLDNEPFTPVDYQNQQNIKLSSSSQSSQAEGQAPQVQSYQHMDATAVLLIPYDKAISMGATTRSVAASFAAVPAGDTPAATGTADAKAQTPGEKELYALMQRAALGIFGATPGPDGKLQSKLYSSVESTSYEGFSSLVVPILIAALIIANTMLGSVFERTREIGIYSSVGLAPIHVAALFIAEAAVFAVLGSISGYLIAQTVAKVITSTGLLPGITLNYSSSSAVIATLIVMATVLLSTLYPATQASRLSQPDVDRKWNVSEPEGDLWRFQFPFTVSGSQPLGVGQFLAEFFETHTDTSVGSFYTDRVNYSAVTLKEGRSILNAPLIDGTTAIEHVSGNAPATVNASVAADGSLQTNVATEIAANAPDDMEIARLAMRVWLAPFDMGVSQDVDIFLTPSKEEGLYELQLRLVRRSGETSAWKRVNRAFIGDLRRQLLLWRTLKTEMQREYIRRGRAHVRGHAVQANVPPVPQPSGGMTPSAV